MIKFFRNIRQHLLTENKFRKYLIYAIGEIVLVVIGILIALSINNWNETQKERAIEQNYLSRLLVDLESDDETLSFSKGLSDERIYQVDLLSDVVETPTLTIEYAEHTIESIEKVTWRSYLPLSKIVYNELLNSGNMSLIRSEKLRELLAAYYADAAHWEMILNLEDAQKEFSAATAGLLSKEILNAIENSSSLRNTKAPQDLELALTEEKIHGIIQALASNKEATKWLPQIYHYHILAKKVITILLKQNEALRELVENELHGYP